MKFDPQSFRERVDALFDHADNGMPSAYFEIPDTANDWQPMRVHYHVIAFAAESADIAAARVFQEVQKLRATVPGLAWLFWRNDPRMTSEFDTSTEGMAEAQIEDMEPCWFRVRVRIAVPRGDWTQVEHDQTEATRILLTD
jgi:hypothetical protein